MLLIVASIISRFGWLGNRRLPKILNTLTPHQAVLSRDIMAASYKAQAVLGLFVNLGRETDTRTVNRGGPTCFQIHSELHYRHGALEVPEGQLPRYVQLIFYDPDYTTVERTWRNPQLDEEVLLRPTVELHSVNPFIHIYKTAREQLQAAAALDDNARVILRPQMRL
jgi:hypothetical protein